MEETYLETLMRLPHGVKNVAVNTAGDQEGHRHRMEYAFGMRDDPGPTQSPTDEIVRKHFLDAKVHMDIAEFDRNDWAADPYLLALDEARPIGGEE